uniref:Mothers against decapentaplegic homolog n=1 Tax=Globodera pallida TaxID=36090 RepID=A0A183C4C8_GLOPA
MNSPFSSVSIKREFESGGSPQPLQPQRLHLSGGHSHSLLLASSPRHQPFVPAVRPLGGAGGSDGTPTGAAFARPSHLTEAQQRGGAGPPQRPSSGDANTTITQFLMNYVVGSDREFNKKAIESLIKKLKDKGDELDDFIASVSAMGQLCTKCVTTPRTLDGRLQVAGRKGFPHVVYSKIFRWPDLHKNELKHKNFCIYAFDLKKDQVCVNPYHYERVVSAEGIELESNSGSPSHSSEIVSPTVGHSLAIPPTKNAPTVGGGPFPAARGPGRPPNAFRQQQIHQQQLNTSAISTSNVNPLPPLVSLHHGQSVLPQHQHRMQSVWQQQTTSFSGGDIQNQNQTAVDTPAVSAMFHAHGHNQQNHVHRQRRSSQTNSPHSSMSPQMAAVAIGPQTTYCPPHSSPQHQYALLSSAQIPMANSVVDYGTLANNGNGSHQNIGHFFFPPDQIVTPQLYPSELGLISAPFFDTLTTKPPVFKYVSGVTEFCKAYDRPFISDKPTPLHWLAANYYEFDRRIGETFQAVAECPQIFVDGGLDSTGNARFCLGPLTNTERGEAAEKCRRNIGLGIRLDLKGEGDVWLTVLSKGPVFVQSHYLDVLTEREELGHAHKFVQYTTVKIFDLFKCYECWKVTHLERIMARRVNREVRTRRVRLDNRPTATAGGSGEAPANRTSGECSDDEIPTDDPGVDDFRTLCTMRISFFKGFGLSYPKRTIQETPCWALQLLDEVMNTPLIDHLT